MLLAKEAPEMEGLFFILNQLPELMWLRLTGVCGDSLADFRH